MQRTDRFFQSWELADRGGVGPREAAFGATKNRDLDLRGSRFRAAPARLVFAIGQAMNTTDTHCSSGWWLQTFLADERFWPAEAESIGQTGLTVAQLESLVSKHLALLGTASGRMIAEKLGLSFRIVEEILAMSRTRQSVVHSGAAPFNDYYYMLTEEGHNRSKAYQQASAYPNRHRLDMRESSPRTT